MYRFHNPIEHQPVADYLNGAVNAGRLHHAYIFAGREGVGKCAMALEWARALNCTGKGEKPCYSCESCRKIGEMKHPDVHVYSPTPPGTKKEDSVFESLLEIRANIAKDPNRRVILSPAWVFRVNWIQEIVNMTSFKKAGGGVRVFILLSVEQMNQDAANRFLKTLEEPPAGVLFILTCADLSQVLPTIRSRCIPVHFPPLGTGTIEKLLLERYTFGVTDARASAYFSGGSLSRALEFADGGMAEKRECALRILQAGIGGEGELIPAVADELAKQNGEFPVRDILQLLLYNTGAAIIRKETATGENAGDSPGPDESDAFAERLAVFSVQALRKIASEVEKSIDLIDRNVYLNLILIVLIQKIRKALRRGEYSGA